MSQLAKFQQCENIFLICESFTRFEIYDSYLRAGTSIFVENLSKSIYGTVTFFRVALWNSYFKMPGEIPKCHAQLN